MAEAGDGATSGRDDVGGCELTTGAGAGWAGTGGTLGLRNATVASVEAGTEFTPASGGADGLSGSRAGVGELAGPSTGAGTACSVNGVCAAGGRGIAGLAAAATGAVAHARRSGRRPAMPRGGTGSASETTPPPE